jgi:hypothetical protein
MKTRLLLILVAVLAICLLLVACGTPNGNAAQLKVPAEVKVDGGVLSVDWGTIAASYVVKIDGVEYKVANQAELDAVTLALPSGAHKVALKAVGKIGYIDSGWSKETTVYVDTAPTELEFFKIYDSFHIRWQGTSDVKRFQVTRDRLVDGEWISYTPDFVDSTTYEIYYLDSTQYRIRVRSFDNAQQVLASPCAEFFFTVHDDTDLVATANADGTGAVVWGARGRLVDVQIPDSFVINNTTLPVTEIAPSAFANRSPFVNVTIPESVTTIGKDAFLGCSNLVVKPQLAVPYTQSQLFADVRAIFVADEVVETYKTALNYTAEKIFPASSIDNEGFMVEEGVIKGYYGASDEITLPSSAHSIGEKAFYQSIIRRVTIRDNVKTIGKSAFEGSSLLFAVDFAESLETIEMAAFRMCDNLKTIHFAGTQAQWDAIDKSSANIPQSVKIVFNSKG